MWNDWKNEHGIKYKSPDIEQQRNNIWRENMARIAEENSHGYPWTSGQNEYDDLTDEEFAELFTGYNEDAEVQDIQDSIPFNLWHIRNIPPSVNWVNKGCVNPIQIQCEDDCYAFSALASIEAQYKRCTGNLIKLSGKVILSC